MRQIDWDSALSADDVAWLRASGQQYAPNGMRLEDAIRSNLDADYEDPQGSGDDPSRSALDSTAQGAPPIGTLSAEEQRSVLGESDEDEADDDYDKWTKAELTEEIEERNKDREESLSTSGTKPELIARLRADDEASQ